MLTENAANSEQVNDSIDLNAVRELVEPLVGAHGLSLQDIAWTSGPAGKILRVAIELLDAPADAGSAAPVPATDSSGVTVVHCAAVSRDVSTALDAVELIAEAYNLEVSSPGLSRALKTANDFTRQQGRLAKLRLKQPASDGQSVLRGELDGVSGDKVVIVVDGNRHEVALDNIHQAKLVFELGAQKKNSQLKSKRGSSGRQRKRTGS